MRRTRPVFLVLFFLLIGLVVIDRVTPGKSASDPSRQANQESPAIESATAPTSPPIDPASPALPSQTLPPIQIGTPVLDEIEKIEALAPDPENKAEFERRFAELGKQLETARAKGNAEEISLVACQRAALCDYYGFIDRPFEELSEIHDLFGRGASGARLLYQRALAFEEFGHYMACDNAINIIRLGDSPCKAQALALIANYGLRMTANSGGVSYLVVAPLSPEEASAKAIAIEPNSPRVRSIRSLVLAEAGQLQEAVRQADAAVALCPGSARYLALRAYVKSLCGYPVAEIERDWQASLGLRKINPVVYKDRAMFRYMHGDKDGAMRDADAAIACHGASKSKVLHPAVAMAYNLRGEIFKARGEMAKAFESFNLSLGRARGAWTEAMCFKLGVALAEQGKYEEAARYFDGPKVDQGFAAMEEARVALEAVQRRTWPPRKPQLTAEQKKFAAVAAVGAVVLLWAVSEDLSGRSQPSATGGTGGGSTSSCMSCGGTGYHLRETMNYATGKYPIQQTQRVNCSMCQGRGR